MPVPLIKWKITESHGEAGERIRVIALSKTGRVLATVECIAAFEPGFSIAGKLGDAAKTEVIDNAKRLAERLAEAVEAPSAQQSVV